jgi:hypothetical protein
MKIILIFISLFLNLILYSQDQKVKEDSIVNIIKTELQNKSVDNYLTYRVFDGNHYIYAGETEESELVDYYRIYFIWELNGKFYIKKTDNYNIFPEIEIDANKIFNFVYKNISKIEIERIKPFQLKIEGKIIDVGSSDYGNYVISFNINGIIFSKKILSKEMNYKDNYNYKYNNNLNIVKLKKMLNEVILNLEQENLFKN